MNPRTTLLRVAAISGVAAVLCGMVAAPAVAADGDVDVLNTETVQVYTSPTGEVETQRVYEQLVLTGTGSVDVANPISTDGLRNLDGFGGFDVEDGEQVTSMSVDGEEHLRSVSDFDGDLPLDVTVTYKLDGETVEPGDIVGRSGELEVLYSVTNVTGQPRDVSFPDGSGGTTTETVDVPIPMVGSLTTTAPENFTNVRSDQANIAGDGKGGTKMSFTMTLFPPIGSDTAEFGYTADIVDGVVPRSDVSALPVNPLESPTFASAADSYQGGTDTGAKLAEGAATIDSNLLKLRDGASELLAGLIKLHEGSAKLRAGLADEAAPGAARLAAGTGRAADGAARLADGAGRLDDGLGRLDGGVGDLSSGADRLAAGQRRLAGGLKLLYEGVDALPPTVKAELDGNQDFAALLQGMQDIADGVGTRGDAPDAGTLLGGLNALQYGLDNPLATAEACDAKDTARCGATDALDRIAERLFGAINGPANVDGTVAKLEATIRSIKTPALPGPNGPVLGTCDAVCQQYVEAIATNVAIAQRKSLNDLRDGVMAVSGGVKAKILGIGLPAGQLGGLDRLRAGLSTGVNPAICDTAPDGTCGVKEGALFIRNYGIPTLVDQLLVNIEHKLLENIGRPTPGCDTSATLRCGAAALAAGGGDLTAGVDTLVAGVNKLAAGGSLLSSGAGELSDGLGQIDDGANQLSVGLGEAADGSGKLTDGLGQAREGAPKLVDGAQKLSDKGTSKLVEAGKDTTQTYGQMYATMRAGAERAQAEDMAYGAPEGAAGLTAYSYVIQGEDGETTRNWARGLAGLALLGLGGGGFLLRRRLA